ncbi:MAG TPA: glutaredoxin domain-containing protein [Candidatus Saccharimonadales bacterium]|nr:glutaredoxin domain-containing protein [Candidatus Saccharimonadales bacterium]
MITIYSADWCAFCRAAKDYLTKLDIKFIEKNVEQDPAAGQEAVSKSGQMGIPVIDVDGKVIIGFNKPSLDSALKQAGLI